MQSGSRGAHPGLRQAHTDPMGAWGLGENLPLSFLAPRTKREALRFHKIGTTYKSKAHISTEKQYVLNLVPQ